MKLQAVIKGRYEAYLKAAYEDVYLLMQREDQFSLLKNFVGKKFFRFSLNRSWKFLAFTQITKATVTSPGLPIFDVHVQVKTQENVRAGQVN